VDGKALDTLLSEAAKRWDLPGLAVAVVQGDEAVHLRGLGVRERGKKEAVTPDTVFSIGSLTKAFTGVCLALLVDDGKAGWDDPVRKYLPAFRLFDPLADREVRLRDLLCHRTGLARHDLLWYRAPWSLDETVKRMAFLQPASSFRSRYEYNNLAYIVAGHAIARAAGVPWGDLVRKRLFGPLGMKNAVLTATEAKALGDHATPHRRDASGKYAPIDWYPDEKQVRASGSIKTSVRDLSCWLRLQLNEGVFAGKRIVSAEALRETHTPQVVVSLDRSLARMSETTQHSYGLGWHISDYRGKLLLEHGGSNDGFRAQVFLLPREKIGLVLLANGDQRDALRAAGHSMIDQLLGLPKKDWHGFFLKRAAAEPTGNVPPVKRKPGTRPSLAPSGYAGTYRDAAYGDVTVAEEGKRLMLSWSSFRAPLEHYHYETFVARLGREAGRVPDGGLAVFTLDGDGKPATLRFLGRVFRRVHQDRRSGLLPGRFRNTLPRVVSAAASRIAAASSTGTRRA
jgi:CubicO group peptidase (beta-lactamase class C family)